jgi:hypothetical protein
MMLLLVWGKGYSLGKWTGAVRGKKGRSSSVDVKCSITSSLLSTVESQDGASSAATGGLSLPLRVENCLSYSICIYIFFMSLTQNYCHGFWSIFCLLLRYYHVSATNEVVSRYHVYHCQCTSACR